MMFLKCEGYGNTWNEYSRLIPIQPIERRRVLAVGYFCCLVTTALSLRSNEKVDFAQFLKERTERWGGGSLNGTVILGRLVIARAETPSLVA